MIKLRNDEGKAIGCFEYFWSEEEVALANRALDELIPSDELQRIFLDTQNLCATDDFLTQACKNAIKMQKVFLADEKVFADKNRFSKKANILVSKNRTFQAAEKYVRQGKKVAVLNFAHYLVPGGRDKLETESQEGCLCRTSTLYACISDERMQNEFYKKHTWESGMLAGDDVIYTPGVVVFKSDEKRPKLLEKEKWFSVDVITAAAPKCCALEYNNFQPSDDRLRQLLKSRYARILQVAALQKVACIILGVFGCGACNNPAHIAAEVWNEVVQEYEHSFETIEFAVYCGLLESDNYECFLKEIGGLKNEEP